MLTSDPGLGGDEGGCALFAGRLSPEQGIETLLAACDDLASELPLKILGHGPRRIRLSPGARISNGWGGVWSMRF